MVLNQMCITAEITPGTWVLYNNEKHEVLRVNEKTIIINDGEGEKRISISEVKDSVLKYTVKDKNRIYDLFPNSYKYAINHKNGEIVNGFTQKFKTRAKLGMTVRIDDLYTVDTHNLYNKSDRYGIIRDMKDNLFTIDLTNGSKISIRLHRNKFVLVNEKDVRIFFKLISKN
jgi:hypothetical protein